MFTAVKISCIKLVIKLTDRNCDWINLVYERERICVL
jgi:hypothetical protein